MSIEFPPKHLVCIDCNKRCPSVREEGQGRCSHCQRVHEGGRWLFVALFTLAIMTVTCIAALVEALKQ